MLRILVQTRIESKYPNLHFHNDNRSVAFHAIFFELRINIEYSLDFKSQSTYNSQLPP